MSITKQTGTLRVQDLEVKDDLTLTGDMTVTGDLTVAGDTLSQHYEYVSGATGGSTWTAYTSYPVSQVELNTQGIYYINGKSGSVEVKLPEPRAGEQITIIYCASAQATGDIGYCLISSSSSWPIRFNTTKYTSAKLQLPGIGVTFLGADDYWFLTSPASGNIVFTA